MKTKVIHLIGHLKMGGAETLITDYALKINKDRFDIVIVTLDKQNKTINEKSLHENGIRIIFLGDKSLFYNTRNPLKKIINKIHRHFMLLKLIQAEKPRVIHSHLGVNEYLLPVKGKKNGIKFFYTMHTEVNALFGKGRIKNKIITKYCINRKGMTLISLHSRMKQEAQQMFKTNNCTLLPNGIDMTKFQNVKISKESMLTSLNLTKESFIVGHVGRFANVKNHQFLIDLFPLIKERNPKAHLILIGSGRLESQVKKQVSDNNLEESVHFLGDRKDIPELMSVMDVFIFPSIYEGFGNVLIEAQAAGIKCIVSDTVPKEAIVTNLVTTIALDAPKENWLQAVTAIEGSEKVKDELEKHDINNVVSRLEALYLE